MAETIASILFFILIYFVFSYIYDSVLLRERYINETPIEQLCPEYANEQTRFMPAKCIEYFNGKENK